MSSQSSSIKDKMAEKKIKDLIDTKEIPEEISEYFAKTFKKLQQLEDTMNARFDKLKEAVIGYVNLGSEMARGSVITTLKAIQMRIQELELMRTQAIQQVLLQQKVLEQVKAEVAHFEGRIAERKAMIAEEAEKAKTVQKKHPGKDQMAQELEVENLLIKSVQEQTRKSGGEPFWVVKTDKGEYTMFETKVFDEVAKNQGNICKLKTFRDETHANIRGFIEVVEVKQAAEAPPAQNAPNAGGVKIEMLVSYAKDLVIATIEKMPAETLKEKGLADFEEAMKTATNAVIKSYQRISGEIQMVKIKNTTGKDLAITFGTNRKGLIAGTIRDGETEDIPIEPTDFLHIF